MADWNEIKLKDLCEKITVGHVGSMAGEYVENGIPFLRSLNIKPYYLDHNNMMFVDKRFHEKLKKSSLKPGDVAVVRTGYPGTACVIPKNLGEVNCSDLVIIRPGKNLNPHYLAALFNSAFGRSLVSGNLVGAAQQHFNVTVAKELKLLIPPKSQQDKIAAILSAYDDLIENNKRRIALLEKMAEEIYREWFVRFRFPGYQTNEFEKGIPKGWESKASDELIDVLSGGTPKTDNPNFWDGVIPFFTPRDATNEFYAFSTEKYITHVGLEKCNSKLYKKNTIFITARGTVGKLALAYVDMAMNQSCYALLPKDRKNNYFFFLAMRQAISHIKGVSKSGVFENIVVDTFKIVPILLPDNQTLNAFDKLITPIFEQIGLLSLQNRNLNETKNQLLPRLISGKLSVEDMDIQFPPSMQEADED